MKDIRNWLKICKLHRGISAESLGITNKLNTFTTPFKLTLVNIEKLVYTKKNVFKKK